jgi:hypothetical protein
MTNYGEYAATAVTTIRLKSDVYHALGFLGVHPTLIVQMPSIMEQDTIE